MKPGVPSDWPANEIWSGNWEQVTCPECLMGRAGMLTLTYSIRPDGKAITCLRCKLTSHHREDIEFHYCGKCKVFHDDIWPPARHWWVTHPEPEPIRPPLWRQHIED